MIPKEFQYSLDEVRQMLNNNEEVTWTLILKVDHAHHYHENNYDNGLSFIDRLYHKLQRPFNLQWNIEELKETIRTSNQPEYEYLNILGNLLTQEMVEYYGV